jgi:hypothetical protein
MEKFNPWRVARGMSFVSLAVVLLACPSMASPSSFDQIRLGLNQDDPIDKSFDTPSRMRVRQNDTLCDAGSAQWTGQIPLGTGREMFYCMAKGLISHLGLHLRY